MPTTETILSVTIVRHAETCIDLIRPRVISGQNSMPLTGSGKIQAKELAKRLARVQYSEIFTSDSLQALETLDVIRKLQVNPSFKVDQRLRECNVGKITGMSYSDIMVFLNESSTSFDDYIDQEGESNEKLQVRVQEFYTQIIRNSIANPKVTDKNAESKNILIITHGGWIDSLMRFLINDLNFKLEIKQNSRFAYKSSIYQFTIQKIMYDNADDYEYQGIIDMMNDASHLANISKELERSESGYNVKMPLDSPISKPFTTRMEILGMLGIYSPFEPKYSEKSSPLGTLVESVRKHDMCTEPDAKFKKDNVIDTSTIVHHHVQRIRTLGW